LDIIESPLDANDQSRLQESVNATGAARQAQHPSRFKNTFYFNELNGHVNEKIRAPNPL
jgi:hypothetical protein